MCQHIDYEYKYDYRPHHHTITKEIQDPLTHQRYYKTIDFIHKPRERYGLPHDFIPKFDGIIEKRCPRTAVYKGECAEHCPDLFYEIQQVSNGKYVVDVETALLFRCTHCGFTLPFGYSDIDCRNCDFNPFTGPGFNIYRHVQ